MSTRDTGIRCALIGIIAVTLLATSGCGWFRSKKEPYKNAAESRPLEIPQHLDQPKTDPAMRIPDLASTVARAPATSSAERRGGQEGVSTGRTRWWPYQLTTTDTSPRFKQ